MIKSYQKLFKELNKKINNDLGKGAILGTEIKKRRLKYNLTLHDAAGSICSASYLCKIENNSISASKEYLNEICKRLDLAEVLDTLTDLNELVSSALKDVFFENIDALKEKLESCEGLNNYRTLMLELMFNTIIYNFKKESKIISQINISLPNVEEKDLIIILLILAISEYLQGKFLASLEILSSLENVIGRNEIVDMLYYRYMFLSNMALNNIDTTLYYSKLKEMYVSRGYYKFLDRLNYAYAYYLLNNNVYSMLDSIVDSIYEIKYSETIKFLLNLKNNGYTNYNEFNKENLLGNAYFLYLFKENKENCEKELDQINITHYSFDFNSLYLEYLLLDTDEAKLEFVLSIVVPSLSSTNEVPYSKFFIHELGKLCTKKGSYKNYYEACVKLNIDSDEFYKVY